MEDELIVEQVNPIVPADNPTMTEDMVEQAHAAATAVLITNSDPIKKEIIQGAEKVVKNKTKAITERSELEAKKALFESNKGACACFGFDEETTERWAVTTMKIWNGVMTFLWILAGSITFAPVVFISGKLGCIIKKTWVTVILAIVLYIGILFSPWLVKTINELRGAGV